MRFVYGLKLKLYFRSVRRSSEGTVAEALRILRKSPDFDPYLSITENLHAFVADNKVVAHLAAQKRMPGKVSMLAKRLQRAKVRYKYQLPEPD